ncbi:MAG: hypothetical protein V4471_05110 [Pseudomonadota bacterium]
MAASFDFIRKVKKAFRGSNKPSNKPMFNPNHGYFQGEIGRTYLDPKGEFSYDFVALAVRSIVIQMHKDLTIYYESRPEFNARKEVAKQLANYYITYYVDPIAKEAEKDETSARGFHAKVVAMYKELNVRPPKLNLHFYVPAAESEMTKL